MKSSLLACVLLCALPLSGCSEFDSVVTTLSSSEVQAASISVKNFASGLACATSAASLVAAGIEESLAQNLVGANNIVYTTSKAACAYLGGSVVSPTLVTTANVIAVAGK